MIEDPDAHHAQAVAAGSEIVMGLTDQDYGSRGTRHGGRRLVLRHLPPGPLTHRRVISTAVEMTTGRFHETRSRRRCQTPHSPW